MTRSRPPLLHLLPLLPPSPGPRPAAPRATPATPRATPATPAATSPPVAPPAPPSRWTALARWRRAGAGLATAAAAAGLLGCASTPVDEAQRLLRAGQPDAALSLLSQARARSPGDARLQALWLRQRGLRVQQLLAQAEAERVAGRLDLAASLLAEAQALDPDQPRLPALREALAAGRAQQARLGEAEAALAAGRLDEAEARLQPVLQAEPGHPAAVALRRRIDARRGPPEPVATAPALQQPVGALSFHEAPLRQVFEAIGQAAGLGFVFDREVRGDAKVSLQLRGTTVDEAMRILLGTQGLARKALNGHTWLVYPDTPAKQREHLELQTRAFYLANADVKQAQAMVRTLARVRDLHVDERLNLLLVRDTPEAVAHVERLLATIDLPEPEVVLDLQVLELGSDQLSSLGLGWPGSVSWGQANTDGSANVVPPALAALSGRAGFRAWVANPALLASLNATSGATTLISNPSIRVRNRDKARVLVGDKLPVFTTTATANVGVSASVSYLDVGLKLEIEPVVLLDNEVAMKVNLEVSSLVKEVAGPSGSKAYQVGSRSAGTSLRLKDGETQVLAGLISDEERRSASGIPGLSTLAGIGPLFGTQGDSRVKTEVVLLITPRIVRNLPLPPAAARVLDSGLEATPGRAPLRVAEAARPQVPLAGGDAPALPGAGAAGGPAAAAAADGGAAPGAPAARLRLRATERSRVGELVSVTLANGLAATVRGQLQFDPRKLQAASVRDGGDGRIDFELAAGGEQVLALRVLPEARGDVLTVTTAALQARDAAGAAQPVQADSQAAIEVEAE